MARPRILWLLFLACVGTGCVGLGGTNGLRLADEARGGRMTLVVEHQPRDVRRLDVVLVDVLRARGLRAVLAPSAEPGLVVTYVDRWYWDLRMYMIDFRVDVRHPESQILVATGRSYQTSLVALGETFRSVIERAVDAMMEGGALEYGAAEARRERALEEQTGAGP